MVSGFFQQVDKHMSSLKDTIKRLVGSFPRYRNLDAQRRDVEVQKVLKGVNVSGLPGFVALPNISKDISEDLTSNVFFKEDFSTLDCFYRAFRER